MEEKHFDRAGSFLQRYFPLLLVAAYAGAAVIPQMGIAAREITVGHLTVGQQPVPLTLPMLLLAGLLLNAGLSTTVSELAKTVQRPKVVLAGLITNLVVPVGFIALLLQVMRVWHNVDETQNLLVGLAIVAAMPVAGSSTAWSQHVSGNMALSLGLVVLSTLLSPLTTPLVLRTFGWMANADYAEILQGLSGFGTGTFLVLCVVIPSVTGLLIRRCLGDQRIARLAPKMKFFNRLVLLFLCYMNAAGSLPQVLGQPDWDFLAVVLAGVTGLCVVAFSGGWVLARLLKVDESQQRSLMFGLGMNNNGTGMVLASTSLPGLPHAVFPVLVYNLVQHLVASGVKWSSPGIEVQKR